MMRIVYKTVLALALLSTTSTAAGVPAAAFPVNAGYKKCAQTFGDACKLIFQEEPLDATVDLCIKKAEVICGDLSIHKKAGCFAQCIKDGDLADPNAPSSEPSRPVPTPRQHNDVDIPDHWKFPDSRPPRDPLLLPLGYNEREIQCKASHHACAVVDTKALLGAKYQQYRQEFCNNCYDKCDEQQGVEGCNADWCRRNREGTHSFQGCVGEQTGVVPKPGYSKELGLWTSGAIECAASYMACVWGSKDGEKKLYCHQCYRRCSSWSCQLMNPYFQKRWCPMHAQICKERM